MSSGDIWVDTADPFNKRVVFVFNMQTYLTCLAYKGISFCFYCLIFFFFLVVIIFLWL